MRDYETRFARLEETVVKETAEIRETSRRRLDQLEQYIKREFEALESRLKAEREERFDAGSQHSRDAQGFGRTLTRRLRELDDRGVSVETGSAGSRAAAVQGSVGPDAAAPRRDFTLLEQRFQELRHGKTDRAALATLFTGSGAAFERSVPDTRLGF